MASVADLVEPLVLVADAVPDAVREDAARLHDAGAVTLEELGPLRVTASVTDGVASHHVELGSTAEGLTSSCDCPAGSSGLVCAHSLATALVTWESAPRRRS